MQQTFDSYDYSRRQWWKSTRQALFIRDKLKLNPLLVSTHPPQTVTKLVLIIFQLLT